MGEAVLPNGDRFKGNYEDNARHGYGFYVFRNGARYDGTYKNGKRDGYGLMVYPDGSIYAGEWQANNRHGFGLYIYANGDRYEGEWENNEKNGIGLYYYVKDTFKYVGSFENGKRHGPGELITQEYKFVGDFVNDLPFGPGVFFTFSGQKVTGEYIELLLPEEDSTSKDDLREDYDENPPEPVARTEAFWVKRNIAELHFVQISMAPSALEISLLKRSRRIRVYFEKGGTPEGITKEELDEIDKTPLEGEFLKFANRSAGSTPASESVKTDSNFNETELKVSI